jgi:cytochrome c biogenesis protein CcdA/glutaredoxin
MRIRFTIFSALVAAVLLFLTTPGAAVAQDDDALVIFWRIGCPYCEAEREFLGELSVEYPELQIIEYEVGSNAANRELFISTLAEYGMVPMGVPTTIYQGRVWEGFNDATGREITAAVAAAFAPVEEPGGDEEPPPDGDIVDIPIFGEVNVEDQSLLISTLAIGFVDGFNPCSLWVLSMLLALVLHTGSRRRVLAVGSVFLVVTTALYGLYMIGAYSVLSYLAFVTWIRVAVAVLALGFGLVNLKDFFWFGRGLSFTIPEGRKAGLYQRMRAVAVSDAPLPRVLAGTAALAVGVSLIETPCTAGFPVMWANLLGSAGVGAAAALVLFGIYMAVFLIDELAVLGVAVVAMRVTKVQERHGRILKLVGGMVMVTLAGVLIAAPEMMESASGAVAVFLIAATATIVVLVLDKFFRRDPGESENRRKTKRTRNASAH